MPVLLTPQAAAEFFGLPLPPNPSQPCPCPDCDDELDEWKKHIGGGTENRTAAQTFDMLQGLVSSQYPYTETGQTTGEPRKKGVVYYVIGLVGSDEGYFVDLSTQNPFMTYDPYDETEYPNGYLTLELSLQEWQSLMVGQVIPTTLSF